MSLLGVGVTSPALDPIILGLCTSPDIHFYSVSCVLHPYSISSPFLMQCHNPLPFQNTFIGTPRCLSLSVTIVIYIYCPSINFNSAPFILRSYQIDMINYMVTLFFTYQDFSEYIKLG